MSRTEDVVLYVEDEVLDIEDEVIGPRPRPRGPRCRGRCPRCRGGPRHLERRPQPTILRSNEDIWCVTSCVLTYSALDLEDDVLDVVKNEVLEILDVEALKAEDEVIGPRPRPRGPRC